MQKYHKIQSVYKRDPANRCKTFLEGEFSIPEFAYLQDCLWVGTEKVDGTNVRVMWDGNMMRFGSKTEDAQLSAKLVARLNERFLPQRDCFAKVFPDGACLYGEGYGAKIGKGGGNYRADQDFVLFDVRVGDWWLRRDDIEDVATKLSIDVVPVLGAKTLRQWVEFVAAGFGSQWGPFIAEGVVLRPETELRTRGGDRIITKIKYKDFCTPQTGTARQRVWGEVGKR